MIPEREEDLLTHAKQKTVKLNRLYAFIRQVNKDILRVRDQDTLFRNSCNIATDLGQFKMAWIGLFDTVNDTITLVAQNGIPAAHMQQFITAPVRKNEPMYEVLQTGNHFTCQDIVNDIHFEQWKPFI